jgi:hypothetical protein
MSHETKMIKMTNLNIYIPGLFKKSLIDNHIRLDNIFIFMLDQASHIKFKSLTLVTIL